jgi:hypothetical protein
MPWGQEPMKGVAHDVTLRGAASRLRSGDARMGKPGAGDAASSLLAGKATGGTETSHYPEEEKATAIPPVAASEKG